jgi:hypothetical protein
LGKRSDFARRPQDGYDTPESAVAPLLPHLVERTRFIEPCRVDARSTIYSVSSDVAFVTNPPWARAAAPAPGRRFGSWAACIAHLKRRTCSKPQSNQDDDQRTRTYDDDEQDERHRRQGR